MNPLILGPLLDLGRDLIGRLVPDKEEARKAEADFLRFAMEGELKQVIAQLEINAREAAHPSVFVAGWRPACGWLSAIGVGYASILQPLLSWLSAAKGWPLPPEMNLELLWAVISGMLGIGGLRTFEKSKGVAK